MIIAEKQIDSFLTHEELNELNMRTMLFQNVKTYGATGNGITDDTAAIQAAINATPTGGTLFIPTGAYMINNAGTNGLGSDGGIRITKSMRLVFDFGAELKAISNQKTQSIILWIKDTSNVEINGGKITGKWVFTPNAIEVQCHGIRIVNSSNINISGTYFSKLQGDGIDMYQTAPGLTKNINIQRCEFTDLERFGVTVSECSDVIIRDCNFHDIYSDYSCSGGIDIEKGVNNVLVTACKFTNIGIDGSSVNGAFSVYGGNGLIRDINYVFNDIVNCRCSAIVNKCSNFNISHNNFDSVINIRGDINAVCYGKITNNHFKNAGGIAFGFGGGIEYEFVKGMIIDKNEFVDFASWCISAMSFNLSNTLISNNVFRNSPNRFSLPETFATNIIYRDNIDAEAGLLN